MMLGLGLGKGLGLGLGLGKGLGHTMILCLLEAGNLSLAQVAIEQPGLTSKCWI